MEYAQVDKTVSLEEEKQNTEYDDSLVGNEVPQVSLHIKSNISCTS